MVVVMTIVSLYYMDRDRWITLDQALILGTQMTRNGDALYNKEARGTNNIRGECAVT